MKVGNTIYVKDRGEWHSWLAANFQTENEIWLIFPHKNSGRTRIQYNEAVEEALSFGWIDSTVKSWCDRSSVQRFSRRKPGSKYSQANIERLRWLSAEGKIHPSMLESIQGELDKEFVFPLDIINAISNHTHAWENFQKFSPPYQRIRVAYIDGARNRPDEFKKRLNNFIKKTEQNRLIGFGGIEKYY